MEIAKLYLFITCNLFLNIGGLAGNDLVYILLSVSSWPLFPKVSNSMFQIENVFFVVVVGEGNVMSELMFMSVAVW